MQPRACIAANRVCEGSILRCSRRYTRATVLEFTQDYGNPGIRGAIREIYDWREARSTCTAMWSIDPENTAESINYLTPLPTLEDGKFAA